MIDNIIEFFRIYQNEIILTALSTKLIFDEYFDNIKSRVFKKKIKENIKDSELTILERTFSFEDYCKIIDQAELLKEIDEINKSSKARNDRLEVLVSSSIKVQGVPEKRVYEFANELGIPREYVEKAIASRYPSEEEKLKDLEKVGAKIPEIDIINHWKTVYSNRMLSELRNNFLGEDFGMNIDGDYIFFFSKNKKTYKKRFLWKTWYSFKKQKEKLAWLKSHACCFTSLHIESPLFLKFCSGLIKELKNKITLGVSYDYPIDLTKIPEFK